MFRSLSTIDAQMLLAMLLLLPVMSLAAPPQCLAPTERREFSVLGGRINELGHAEGRCCYDMPEEAEKKGVCWRALEPEPRAS